MGLQRLIKGTTMNTTDTEMAKLVAKFMMRVQMSGEEVPAFSDAMNWLNDKAVPPKIEQDIPSDAKKE